MLCFDAEDLKNLFETPHKSQIIKELIARGYSLDKLPTNKEELREIAYSMNMINDKEDVEIFLALYLFLKFYPAGTKVCFLLNGGVDPGAIRSLAELKKSIKEYDLTDFIFMLKDGLVPYQLKAYYGDFSAEAFFAHAKEVLLKKYGNDIGSTNLLFFLGKGGELNNDMFQELHEKLKTLEIKGTGHILVAYNEAGKFDVLNTIHPIFGTTRIEHEYEENKTI